MVVKGHTTNQDVVGEECLINDKAKLTLSDKEKKLAARIEQYSRLLNVEFDWPSHLLQELPTILGSPPHVSSELIRKGTSKMKLGKAAGPPRIID